MMFVGYSTSKKCVFEEINGYLFMNGGYCMGKCGYLNIEAGIL